MNASSEQATGVVRIYDGRGDGTPVDTLDKMHRAPVHLMTVRRRAAGRGRRWR
jgi:peptidylprolyl isomerase domain and WD repeat-containing protein 1